MSLVIASVSDNSLAAEAGIKNGEELIKINGLEVRDFLDLEYLSSDYHLRLRVKNALGRVRTVHIYRETARPLGIEPVAYRHRNCKNHCIFCFIDQMPKKLRGTLYNKDDDFLFSFVFGNYITLTNLSDADYKRIFSQHISPLYISLHTTNPELRQRMMRSHSPIHPLKQLRLLARHDIEYHLQIVCVPGYNDGDALKQSVSDILESDLPALSIGIVPVGLTMYREGLCHLEPFDKIKATKCLDLIDELRNKYHSDIVYPADELFVLAEREIPSPDYYQDYPQLENGIGMLRMTAENYQRYKRGLLKTLRSRPGMNYRLYCSRSAYSMMRDIARDLNRLLKGQRVSLQSVACDFFGEHVSVSGLITYEDLSTLTTPAADEIAILPNSLLNQDLLTLDGYTLEELKSLFPAGLLLVDPFFESHDWA